MADIINPTNSGPQNPAEIFCQWSSKLQCFTYYDKEQKDGPDKGKVKLPMPFSFIPIHKALCARGYVQKTETSYISNEVTDEENGILNLKAYNVIEKGKVVFSGTWKQLKEEAEKFKAKWTQSVYCVIKHNGKYIIANLQLNGAAIATEKDGGKWFDVNKKMWGKVVVVKDTTEEVNGAVTFTAPVFSLAEITKDEVRDEVAKMQQEVINYMKAYEVRNSTEPQIISSPAAAPAKLAENTNFSNQKAEMPATPTNDDPLDNDDLPF